MSDLEDTLVFHIQALGLPAPEREHRFAALATGGVGKGLRARLQAAGLKDWRFDLAWPDKKIACEVEGGIYIAGRHTRGAAFEEDCAKYNEAAIMGWRVLRVAGNQVKSGQAVAWIERILGEKETRIT